MLPALKTLSLHGVSDASGFRDLQLYVDRIEQIEWLQVPLWYPFCSLKVSSGFDLFLGREAEAGDFVRGDLLTLRLVDGDSTNVVYLSFMALGLVVLI